MRGLYRLLFFCLWRLHEIDELWPSFQRAKKFNSGYLNRIFVGEQPNFARLRVMMGTKF